MLHAVLPACLLAAAAPTPFGPSFALAVQVQPGAWLGPVSLSANGDSVEGRTYYAPLLALTHASQPARTTEIAAHGGKKKGLLLQVGLEPTTGSS